MQSILFRDGSAGPCLPAVAWDPWRRVTQKQIWAPSPPAARSSPELIAHLCDVSVLASALGKPLAPLGFALLQSRERL